MIKYVGDPIFVSLSCATANATIYYTADGSDPTPGATSTQQYTSPIAVSNFGATTTIKAVAVSPGHMDSVLVEGAFFLSGKKDCLFPPNTTPPTSSTYSLTFRKVMKQYWIDWMSLATFHSTFLSPLFPHEACSRFFAPWPSTTHEKIASEHLKQFNPCTHCIFYRRYSSTTFKEGRGWVWGHFIVEETCQYHTVAPLSPPPKSLCDRVSACVCVCPGSMVLFFRGA